MVAFGPIPSRRLGLSLGINNIVSRKVCSYSCVYCQIGETHKKSVISRDFYEPENLVENVEKHLNMLDGIKLFAAGYRGRLDTETMLVKDHNDSSEQIEQTALFVAGLNPKAAYLSIPIRPPAVKEVKPETEENMAMAWQTFRDAGIITELPTGFEGVDTGFTGTAFEDSLNISAVHPLRKDTLRELLICF